MPTTILQANVIERALNEAARPFFSHTSRDIDPTKFKKSDVPHWEGGAISWEELVEIEPDLRWMLQAIKLIRRPKAPASFCANRIWYCCFKPRLLQLVGHSCRRKNSALRSSAAYDTAYQKLYNALPDCRNCGC
ncbi:hypothetical protein [Solidesulfovibrio magneticus]|uniref:Uncharacterized protein n=1 Tax=Solidesulfovibrio magneticus (strain ATCC 700980 / DSM 13731 / RS-1) TaxID=573370 RepID=C4XJ40_SOLM1|nr:hypothetical protein [Solidesulfovibrio magneticus]BAH74204.1 hypothetical protein DMR_07130 [Solidesulfovibrio magneticus RS-1]